MPSFDVVSEVDVQEVRNAVDQAQRELATRFDFKGTDSTIELKDDDDRARVRVGGAAEGGDAGARGEAGARKVSLKALDYGKVEEASKGAVRQTATLNVGINDEKAREIGKFIKGLGLKGVQHQVQGEQLRVTGKKRDDLQAAIAALREHDFGVPLAVHQLPRLTCPLSLGGQLWAPSGSHLNVRIATTSAPYSPTPRARRGSSR